MLWPVEGKFRWLLTTLQLKNLHKNISKYFYLVSILIEPNTTSDPPASIIKFSPVSTLPDLSHVLGRVKPYRGVCIHAKFTAIIGVASSARNVIVLSTRDCKMLPKYTLTQQNASVLHRPWGCRWPSWQGLKTGCWYFHRVWEGHRSTGQQWRGHWPSWRARYHQ